MTQGLQKTPIKNPRKISNNKYYADTSWFYYLYFLDDIYANSLKQDRKHALNCLTEQNRTQTLLFPSKSILRVDFLCTLIVFFFRNGSLYIFFSANARLSQSKIVGAWLVHGRDNKRFKLARWREAISKARRP